MRRLDSNLSFLRLVFLSLSDDCRDWGRVGLTLKRREANVHSYNRDRAEHKGNVLAVPDGHCGVAEPCALSREI